MRILDDGTVEIQRRDSAGKVLETKVVDPKNLPSYGIPYSKYADELDAYQKMQQTDSGEGEKVRSGADAKVVATTKSGLRSVESAKERLKFKEQGDKVSTGLMSKLQLYGASTDLMPWNIGDLTPWGRGLEKDLFDAADAVLRMRTGAAAPEEEIRRYLKNKGPRPTDSPKVQKEKLDAMEQELMDVLVEMGEKTKNDPLGIL